jgi:hypothetical protein
VNGDEKESVVHTDLDPRSIPLGRAELRLVKLEPYPVTSGSIPPGDYRVTLAARLVP